MKHIEHRTKIINCRLLAAWLDRDTGEIFVQRKRLPVSATGSTAGLWADTMKYHLEQDPKNFLVNTIKELIPTFGSLTFAVKDLKEQTGVNSLSQIWTSRI